MSNLINKYKLLKQYKKALYRYMIKCDNIKEIKTLEKRMIEDGIDINEICADGMEVIYDTAFIRVN